MQDLTGKIKHFEALTNHLFIQEVEYNEVSGSGFVRADSDQNLLKVGIVLSIGDGEDIEKNGLDKLKKGDIVIYREFGRDTWGGDNRYFVEWKDIIGKGIPLKSKKPLDKEVGFSK